MGYKGEGEWGLRVLLGGEEVLKTYVEGAIRWWEEVGDGLMREEIGEWKGGSGVLE